MKRLIEKIFSKSDVSTKVICRANRYIDVRGKRMSPKVHKSWLKLLLTIAMASASLAESSAFAANQCTDKLIQACNNQANATSATLATTLVSTGNTKADTDSSALGQKNASTAYGQQSADCAST